MLNQPINQVKMTNVAIIKYKISGKIFQIACYRNKAINWRNGVEKDLDEVLQYNEVYTNVSKGDVASSKDLQKYFPNTQKDQIIKTILEKGDLQITDKEREAQQQILFRDIISFLTEKCVHSKSNRPISSVSIEQAVKDIHFKIKNDQPAKKQALACLKRLEKKFYIMRAQMKIKLVYKESEENKLEEKCKENGIQLNDRQIKNQEVITFSMIDSKKYRLIETLIKSVDGYIEVIENVSSNRQVNQIDMEQVNLQIRSDFDGNLSDSQDEQHDFQQITTHLNNHDKKQNQNHSKQQHVSNSDIQEDNYFHFQNQKKGKLAQLKTEEKEQIHKQKDKLKKKEKQKQQYQEELQQKQQLEQQKKEKQEQQSQINKKSEQQNIEDKQLSCNSCINSLFSNNIEYRQHFKSEWHLSNLKRKMQKQELLSEEQFKLIQFEQNLNQK